MHIFYFTHVKYLFNCQIKIYRNLAYYSLLPKIQGATQKSQRPRWAALCNSAYEEGNIGENWSTSSKTTSREGNLWRSNAVHHCVAYKMSLFRITQYIGDTHNARTLILMNTRTQTLPLGASSKTVPPNPQDWRSHHRRLAVDGNVAYHWKHKRR
jgi:hypothetical protein